MNEFKCTICDREFKQQAGLTRHLNNHKKKKKQESLLATPKVTPAQRRQDVLIDAFTVLLQGFRE